MKSNQENENELRSIRDIMLNLLWLSKFTIIIIVLAFSVYFLEKDKFIFDLLTSYGFIMLIYAGLMSQGYSSGYSGYNAYIKPEYDKSINRPARDRYFSAGVLYGIKGIIVMIIGIIMLTTLK